MENMENKMQTTELSPREEYHQEFLPQVHKIGANNHGNRADPLAAAHHLLCL